MSEQLFDEVPVVGKKYKFGDWKIYSVHDEDVIRGFFGEYRWLSNFHICSIFFEGMTYPSTENAYQAAKFYNYDRRPFLTCTPDQSKKIARSNIDMMQYTMEEWDSSIKFDTMKVVLFEKFAKHKDLRQKLLETGDRYLEETNHWGDACWGYDIKKHEGKNHLGKILMKLRDYWK